MIEFSRLWFSEIWAGSMRQWLCNLACHRHVPTTLYFMYYFAHPLRIEKLCRRLGLRILNTGLAL